jgi:DNA helicase-2/ATP-dependent DNA helicase PcrA
MMQAFRSKLEFYTLEELIKDILETTGYVKELEESNDEDAEDRIENIDELISKAVAYQENHEEAGLSEFLEEVALVADIDQVNEDNNKVLLMTLHSAKGLEFSHVYLAGLEDGVFPSYMTITSDDASEVEEERRLAYVGITRAKDDLTITCARQRMIRGETQYNPISRFVREIPPLLLDHKVPESRHRDFDDYDVDSAEKSHFMTKPFERSSYSRAGGQDTAYSRSGGTSAGYSRSGAAVPYTSQFNKVSDTVFDKPKPKAVARPKRTALENQPYITKAAQGAGSATIAPAGNGSLGYAVGDRVRHLRYGEGTVMKIEPGPRDAQVTVVFDEVGQKIMYAGFAKLKKV